MIDIDLPEVRALQAQPRFYKDGNVDYVEISYVGVKDTNIHKVKPEHMAKFRAEWDAYCDGRPMAVRKGTPLTTLSEISEQRAQELISRNLHTLEEMTYLSDAQCQGLGHGMIALRKRAQNVIAQMREDAKTKGAQLVADKMAEVGSAPVALPPEVSGVFAEQEKKIDALTNQVSALVDIMSKLAKPKRGRPRKGEDEHAA
jgi:hypothetical protein